MSAVFTTSWWRDLFYPPTLSERLQDSDRFCREQVREAVEVLVKRARAREAAGWPTPTLCSHCGQALPMEPPTAGGDDPT